MSARPTIAKFYLDPNEDQEITCLFCSLPKCEQSFTVRGSGKASIIGVHNDCVEKHGERQTKVTGAHTNPS